MTNTYLLNELLNERFELMEQADCWVGSEEEEVLLNREIQRLTNKIQKVMKGGN